MKNKMFLNLSIFTYIQIVSQFKNQTLFQNYFVSRNYRQKHSVVLLLTFSNTQRNSSCIRTMRTMYGDILFMNSHIHTLKNA